MINPELMEFDDFELDEDDEDIHLVNLARIHLGSTGVIPADLYMQMTDAGYFEEFIDALDPEYPANENHRFRVVSIDDEYPEDY